MLQDSGGHDTENIEPSQAGVLAKKQPFEAMLPVPEGIESIEIDPYRLA